MSKDAESALDSAWPVTSEHHAFLVAACKITRCTHFDIVINEITEHGFTAYNNIYHYSYLGLFQKLLNIVQYEELCFQSNI